MGRMSPGRPNEVIMEWIRVYICKGKLTGISLFLLHVSFTFSISAINILCVRAILLGAYGWAALWTWEVCEWNGNAIWGGDDERS
jgi:hypothetical protein